MDSLNNIAKRLGAGGAGAAGRTLLGGVPEGFDALLIGALAGEAGDTGDVLVIARDDVGMARHAEALAFFAPGVECLEFPAWDCLPYDRVSPKPELVNRRIDTLARLMDSNGAGGRGRVILTTVSAVLQRVPPQHGFADASMTLEAGRQLNPDDLDGFLQIMDMPALIR